MIKNQWDPRFYQAAILSGLLIYGMVRLDFDVAPARVLLLLTTALATQWLCTRAFRLPAFDPKSSLISGLSLSLLIRANDPFLAAGAAVIAVSAKFILRYRGKHLFNPTNFGIVAMMVLTGKVWVSPGQWGDTAYFGFLMACLGGLVINRASRSDVTYAFLGFYLAILFGRAAWLGQPASIPAHMLMNGGFLLFTFFMISDPKTTPNTRAGRILFAFLIAAGAGFVHFILFRPNGLLFSLAFFSFLTPLIDRILPGRAYEWIRKRDPVAFPRPATVTQRRFT